jgi:hypothetical protein
VIVPLVIGLAISIAIILRKRYGVLTYLMLWAKYSVCYWSYALV